MANCADMGWNSSCARLGDSSDRMLTTHPQCKMTTKEGTVRCLLVDTAGTLPIRPQIVLAICYGLNCATQNPQVKTLTPNVTTIRRHDC